MFTPDDSGLASPFNAIDEVVEIALYSSALFEQYDDLELLQAANDADYENLYPNIG